MLSATATTQTEHLVPQAVELIHFYSLHLMTRFFLSNQVVHTSVQIPVAQSLAILPTTMITDLQVYPATRHQGILRRLKMSQPQAEHLNEKYT